jgi:hypothetical protein
MGENVKHNLLNNPKTDDPRCMEPMRNEWEFFRAAMVGQLVKSGNYMAMGC